MRREKRYIYMDSAEHRLAIVGINHFRNKLIQGGKTTEDVDALLLKLWKAKAKRAEIADALHSGAQLSDSPKMQAAAQQIWMPELMHSSASR